MAIDLPLTTPEFAARYRKMGLWKDVSLFHLFEQAALRFPEKIAVVEHTRSFTYTQLLDQVESLACALLDRGIGASSVVAMQSKNSVYLPVTHLACNRIGALFIPLHDSWRGPEVQHLLEKSKASAYISPVEYRGFDHAEMLEGMRDTLPDLEHFITFDGATANSASFEGLLTQRTHRREELEALTPDPDLPAAVMLSGGTTSLSKIGRFSSNDLLVMLNNFTSTNDFSADEVIAALAPAGTGATGYVFPILVPLLHGATSVILERWGDPKVATDMIVDNKCTMAVGIPTQLTRLAPEVESRDAADFAQFRCFFNSGAPLLYDIGVRIEKAMNCVCQAMYGTTDGGVPVVTKITDNQQQRLGTVGQVVPGNECQLWGEDLKPVAEGQRGEVVWRGADKSWGYLGDDEQTAKAFTADHFYRSGDLGEFDEEGYLRIVGRIKDMILRGGRNIYPGTLEDAIIKHPAVLDVSVAAMPDRELGERACAFAVLHQDATLELNDLTTFLATQELAIWQLPERLEIMPELPRGPGGKVLKADLTKMVTEKLLQSAGAA